MSNIKLFESKKSASDTSKEEKQIDVMAYHLYNLTFEESKILDPELSEEEWGKYKL